MKKLKLEFWHKIFRFGDLFHTFGLEKIGLNMINKGTDNMIILMRDNKILRQYAKKRGMIR